MNRVYNLSIIIEELSDGDYRYMATSLDLPNLIVAGDTIDEVLAAIPGVARALLETMRETGEPIPMTLQLKNEPYQVMLPLAI